METPEEKKAFYRIGEVAAMFGLKPSHLRFWEQEIPRLKPLKNRKGDRLYTEKDINLIRHIIYLTRDKGLTLEGVRKQTEQPAAETEVRERLLERLRHLKAALLDIKDALDESGD